MKYEALLHVNTSMYSPPAPPLPLTCVTHCTAETT